MILRPATFDDVTKITALGISLFNLHSDFDTDYYRIENESQVKFSQWVENQLKNPSSFIIVAEESDQNKIVGFISGFIKVLFPWFKIKSVGHISFMIVDPFYRKQYLGRMLQEEAVRWFKMKNLSYIELYVDEVNKIGNSAWESYGFVPFKKYLRKKIS